jgi:GNAT superfamily N-acetyltransferase
LEPFDFASQDDRLIGNEKKKQERKTKQKQKAKKKKRMAEPTRAKTNVKEPKRKHKRKQQRQQQQEKLEVRRAEDVDLWCVIDYLQQMFSESEEKEKEKKAQKEQERSDDTKERSDTTERSDTFWDALATICVAHHGGADLFVVGPRRFRFRSERLAEKQRQTEKGKGKEKEKGTKTTKTVRGYMVFNSTSGKGTKTTKTVRGYMVFNSTSGEIRILEVFREHRRTGLGRLLVEYAERHREDHQPQIKLQPRVAARPFWKALGFVPTFVTDDEPDGCPGAYWARPPSPPFPP